MLFPWVVEVATSHPEIVGWVVDYSDENKAKLTELLLSRLDATTFKAIFFHVKDMVDFNRTKASHPPGYFFIETIYLSLVPMLIKPWSLEDELNPANEDGIRPAKLGVKAWKQDHNQRNNIKSSFVGWGYMEEFKYVTIKSFALISPKMSKATGKAASVDVSGARSTLVMNLPMPPPPSADDNPFGYDGMTDDGSPSTTLNRRIFEMRNIRHALDDNSQTEGSVSPFEQARCRHRGHM
ncbi:hypothetical protein COL5a_001030 [Colletotrichum fioriniae]|nr:hypothetical protein COL5a_001030 [Colletotrichum fioriniae]